MNERKNRLARLQNISTQDEKKINKIQKFDDSYIDEDKTKLFKNFG